MRGGVSDQEYTRFIEANRMLDELIQDRYRKEP